MSLLVGRGITKRFGGLSALAGVDLEIQPGEIVGLIGQNGAGKTTLINIITGVVKPDAGEIRFEGRPLTGLPPHRIARRGVARTFQIPQPFPTLTVLQNVMVGLVFGGRGLGMAAAAAEARTTLEVVGLADRADRRPPDLTVMELRRLELARALAAGARLLLLDEINAGLTSPEIADAIALIERLRASGLTILMVEHVMRIIMRVCQRVIVLHFGAKIADAPPAQIAHHPDVIRAYLGTRRGDDGADAAGG
jgi:branched-chain amino acid transport system ATP-binding protein